MSFEKALRLAKENDRVAITALLETYKPLLIHEAMCNGRFDEDLYQELCVTFLKCVRQFRM